MVTWYLPDLPDEREVTGIELEDAPQLFSSFSHHSNTVYHYCCIITTQHSFKSCTMDFSRLIGENTWWRFPLVLAAVALVLVLSFWAVTAIESR